MRDAQPASAPPRFVHWWDPKGWSSPYLPRGGLAAARPALPASDDFREEARAAAGVDQQQAVGSELGKRLRAEMAGHSFLDPTRATHHLSSWDLQPGVDFLEDTRPVPACVSKNPRMVWADHQHGVESDQLRVVQRSEVEREARNQGLRRATSLIDDAPSPLSGEERDTVHARGHSARNREGLPGRALLVLGEAERELAGAAVGRAVDSPWATTAHVADDQLQRAPDGKPGPAALAEHVDARVHSNRTPDWPIDDDHRPNRHRRGKHPVHV